MSALVRCDIEIRLLDDEIPAERSDATIAQAVQDAIGHTGAVVIAVTDYEEEGAR